MSREKLLEVLKMKQLKMSEMIDRRHTSVREYLHGEFEDLSVFSKVSY